MTSPSTAQRTLIRAILDTEFAPEGIVFASDKMHAAMGVTGHAGAVYPDQEVARSGRVIELVTVSYVQMFAKWEKQVDPAQVFDPTLVEGWAERLRTALRAVQDPATTENWFFFVPQVQYMDDPTGNRSRLLAKVEGHGSNSNLVETGP